MQGGMVKTDTHNFSEGYTEPIWLGGSSFLQLFRSKAYNRVATFPAILISAVIHEYVLWAPVRFVVPVLLLEFSTFGGRSMFSQHVVH